MSITELNFSEKEDNPSFLDKIRMILSLLVGFIVAYPFIICKNYSSWDYEKRR